MTKKTLKGIIKNGGATLDHTGNAADIRGGYMVSRKGGEVISIGRYNKIARAVYRTMAKLRPFEFCGVWVSNGLVYVDISVNIKQLAHALRFGDDNEQIEIYDVVNDRTIKCPNA